MTVFTDSFTEIIYNKTRRNYQIKNIEAERYIMFTSNALKMFLHLIEYDHLEKVRIRYNDFRYIELSTLCHDNGLSLKYIDRGSLLNGLGITIPCASIKNILRDMESIKDMLFDDIAAEEPGLECMCKKNIVKKQVPFYFGTDRLGSSYLPDGQV